MRWRGGRESDNVIDGRTVGVGVAGIGLVLAVGYFLLTGDPSALFNYAADQATTGASGQRSGQQVAGGEDDQVAFVKVVLGETEDVWSQVFSDMGRTYEEPKLVLFRGRVGSACGLASEATGPFYCPEDRQVYLDLSFFTELQNQLGARGDFARAYVIAHEVGHHVQNLLGLMERGSGPNRSVPIELQADCFAGLWAKRLQETTNVVEPGDVQEALDAAAAVGDDRLQMQSQGYVVPDSFTHGTSKQRMEWFSRGYAHGRLVDCDTSGS